MALQSAETLAKLDWSEALKFPVFPTFPPFAIDLAQHRDHSVLTTVTFRTWRNRPCSPDTAQMRDDIERARLAYEPAITRLGYVITGRRIVTELEQ